MSSLDYLDLCRLCLVKDRVSVPIFEGEGDVRQIFLKITACLPVKVAREDKLPKKICDDCVYKVELIYQFWHTTANAEKQLLQWLGEVNMEDKQGYVGTVLNPNGMKPEQSNENRLDGTVMQQVSEHQNNMTMGMMDNMGLTMPMMMSSSTQQQITSVPIDNSGSSVQNVQPVAGPSTQTSHDQITQDQTNASTQQEEEEESSEEEENSDDECDGDEGLPIKEESEEDPNRTIEPTTFVNVSLACDEAGPSGLQQQKIADMPEMVMSQTSDVDPKTGSVPRDPLEQNFLVIQNNHQFYLVPMQSPCEYFKDGGESETVQSPRLSPEIKVELPESAEKPENTYEDREDELVSTSESTMSESEENLSSSRRSFKRNCNLKRHMIVHGGAYPYECPICDQGLKTEQSFKFHMLSHEGGKELFHCADCDFKSRKAASVKRHQIRWHANNMYGFKCHICTKIFKNKTMFLKHMEIHTVCNVCDEVYEDNYHLMQHKCKRQDDESDKNYNREQCEEKYQLDVKEHHTMEERKYKLEKMDLQQYSDESFDEVDSNLNLFKGQIYFNCPQCKWRFRTTKLLEKHLKRHSQSFKCNYCDAVFKYKACFLKHKYKHRNNC